jgi:hypothetical protein
MYFSFSFSNCHIKELDNGSLVLIVFGHYINFTIGNAPTGNVDQNHIY